MNSTASKQALVKIGSTQISTNQFALTQVGTSQIGVTQIGISKISTSQDSISQVGSTQIDSTQVNINKNIFHWFGAADINTPEIETAKISFSSSVSSPQFFSVHNLPLALINTYNLHSAAWRKLSTNFNNCDNFGLNLEKT
jgi:hypothetical protein